MNYDEITQELTNYIGGYIDFKELEYDGTVLLDIKGYKIVTHYNADEYMDREDIVRYYKKSESDRIESLHYYPYVRVIIQKPTEVFGGIVEDVEYYVLHLNSVYINSGYQIVNVYSQ